MTKWEYQVKAANDQPTLMKMLNEMGEEGWEVIKMDTTGLGPYGGGVIYFKREKEVSQKSTLLTD